jgi:hypothetical protein
VSRPGGLEAARDTPEQRGLGAGCGEGDAQPCRGFGDAPSDLEQAGPQSGELGRRKRMRLGIASRTVSISQ